MLQDITIGQYYPADSPIHALDPRTKLKAVFFFIFCLFWVNNIYGFIFAGVFLSSVVLSSKVPVGYVVKGLKPVLFVVSLTMLMSILTIPGDEAFRIFVFKGTWQGLRQAGIMAARIFMLISSASMLTLATSTIDLTDGLEALFLKIPLLKRFAHDMSMMMCIALRFIPTLVDETDRIMKAQMSRGADFQSGSFAQRAKSFIPILVPLFVSAFQRAYELAMAMESRCYTGGEGRTRMKLLEYTKLDYTANVVMVIVFCSMVASGVLVNR
ncbi:MAG: energy-coupling factor transporter transmembrane protein EcfT [Eubacteriaceae bacterium]|nr:energy-coupling factor transporter transmembrane protein EcfT [Eubacteriaceae bacterium]